MWFRNNEFRTVRTSREGKGIRLARRTSPRIFNFVQRKKKKNWAKDDETLKSDEAIGDGYMGVCHIFWELELFHFLKSDAYSNIIHTENSLQLNARTVFKILYDGL